LYHLTRSLGIGDASGNRLIAGPRQRDDIAFAHDLVDGFEAGATIADKRHDAGHCTKRSQKREPKS
jgi:putative transposase